MGRTTRRGFALGLAAASGMVLAGCDNGIGSGGAAVLDARTDRTLQYMFQQYPGTRDLYSRASGTLVVPLVTEAGLGLGGSYGEGALRVRDVSVDYYSVTSGSAGLQIGAQQYSFALFFMTDESLRAFRASPGWAAGADIEYVLNDVGDTFRAETTTTRAPVIAVVFAQAGLRLGASLEGTKYTRIIP